MTLWRLDGPLSSRATITGLYPDTWSGPHVRWRLLRCEGGTLTVTVHSDPSLFDRAQTVSVSPSSSRSGAAAVWLVSPTGERESFDVRVEPQGSACTADFDVSATANPSEVIPGSTDDRELGLHFDAFAYEPEAP